MFIIVNKKVISFAEYQDVIDIDERLFKANEGLTDVIIEDILERATTRILNKLQASNWWKSYSGSSLSALDATKILRQDDFTDLCVYFAMFTYIMPKIGSFEVESSDMEKLQFHRARFQELWNELIEAGNWYDADKSATVETSEILESFAELHLVR